MRFDYTSFFEDFDVVSYGKTRNFLSGNVTKLSPLVSRGVIGTASIFKTILEIHDFITAERFLQQVFWREYFYRVWEKQGDDIFSDLKNKQHPLSFHGVSNNFIQAKTGIKTLDEQILQLYETGYLHNHIRLYLASVHCNVAQYHWYLPSKWMYYHLFDGDLASNSLSWQWVAGTNSNKKYYANQDNINHFTDNHQSDTFLSFEYDDLDNLKIPEHLSDASELNLKTNLDLQHQELIDFEGDVALYNSYQLSPDFLSDKEAKRVLLLEPNHFEKYPISSKVLNFIIETAKTYIPNIEIVVENFEELHKANPKAKFHFMEHPSNIHYLGIKHERELVSDPNAPLNSFFKFWNYHLKTWKKQHFKNII